MALPKRKYAGQRSDFYTIREDNRVYVDKTALVYQMTQDYDCVFLSRPRRFGKSLLCSTLECYFEGRHDLFEGLAIDELETEWKKYPVLHFDMSGGKHQDKDALCRYLNYLLEDYEKKYGITPSEPDHNTRLSRIIKEARAQTQLPVVIIIDEYDAPLLDVVHEEQNLSELRKIMRNFYSPIKQNIKDLHFVFITGITKFSQLSIFSELNNLRNISMVPEYATICGISEEELLTQLSPDIDLMAEKLGETREETIKGLKVMYDGYHFTWPSPDMYNPFSVINAFTDGYRSPFWFGSGTPTYLIEMLRKFEVQPEQISGVDARAADFDAPTENMTTIVPLLYQSGYVTITGKDPDTGLYHLDIPNKEVREGLLESLLPYFVSPRATDKTGVIIAKMRALIRRDDMDGALAMLRDFLTGVPYVDYLTGWSEIGPDGRKSRKKIRPEDYEGHYQQLLYVIFSLLGCHTNTEVRTARGRIDMTLETDTRIYVVEIKVDRSAQTALDQIDARSYTARYTAERLPVFKLGINFDTKARTIEDWKLEQAE